MTEKGFSELNLEELEVLASNWAQEYDVIEKIALYRGVDARVRYVFVVTAPPPILDKETRKKLRNNTYLIEIDGEYVESISKDKYVPVPVEDSLVAETIDYYNWTQTNCWHIKDDLQSAYNDLESVYKRLEVRGKHASEFINEWMWFNVESGENIEDYNLVNVYSCWVLYQKTRMPLPDSFLFKTRQVSSTAEAVQDIDAIIEKFTIIPESDYEIKIKEKGKQPETYNHERLGFKDNTATGWNIFLGILNKSGTYSIGQAGEHGTTKRKEYNRKLSYLRVIDKKLNYVFHRDFSLQFSKNYRLYRRVKKKGYGVYEFKFQVKFSLKLEKSTLKTKYEKYPKDKLLKHLKNISAIHASTPEKGLKLQIDTIVEILLEKYKMTDDDIKDHFDPKSDHEVINNMFSDLEKS